MAKEPRPDYFYHPVVGAISPAMLGIYMSVKPAAPQSALRETTSTDNRIVRAPMTLSKTASCAVTGEILPISQMIRFVIAPDGTVTPDLTHKLPGTFLWIKADKSVLKKAIWRNSFAGTTRQTAHIPDNLLESLANSLNRSALQTLSMAKRAGELLFGFTKVDEALHTTPCGVYVVASDAKENGREKLERLAIAKSATVVDIWSSAELSAAIGEENIIHIVLAEGGLTQKLLEIVTKLKAVKSET